MVDKECLICSFRNQNPRESDHEQEDLGDNRILVLALMLLSINVINGSESPGELSEFVGAKRYHDWKHSTMLHGYLHKEKLSSGTGEIGTLNELGRYL